MKKIFFLISILIIILNLNSINWSIRTFATYKSPWSNQIIEIRGTDNGWEINSFQDIKKFFEEAKFTLITKTQSPDKIITFKPHENSPHDKCVTIESSGFIATGPLYYWCPEFMTILFR